MGDIFHELISLVTSWKVPNNFVAFSIISYSSADTLNSSCTCKTAKVDKMGSLLWTALDDISSVELTLGANIQVIPVWNI